ncbi:retrotransposon protein, putative, ty1-copia subclass, partial [Tanacetum coccineum]
MALPVQNINHSAFRSMFKRERLSDYDAYNEVACLIRRSITPELHKKFENSSPYDMIRELKSMFEKQARVERFDLIQNFHACKQEEGKPVGPYILKMKGYVEQLERLGYVLPFVRNYNIHNMGKTLGELHALLIKYEKGLPKNSTTTQVMAIQGGRIQKSNKKSQNAKGKGKGKGKGKDKSYISKPKNHKPSAKEGPVKDDTCHHCKESCEALVKRDTPDKLQQRSVKCIFIGYPKEMMGYYFYFPPENKIVVARYAELLEKNPLSQEISGRAEELEEIQDEDTLPYENTSEIPMEVEGFEPPQEEVVPIRRYARTHRALDRLCLNVKVEEHSLRDLNEPPNYTVAILDPESDKWVDAMNAEKQSMKDNQVWCLVYLPPNCKTVGNKWLFKKKTDMDGNLHTYRARVVAKGFTQTYGVDYEETLSHVVDIRAIRILIAIAAFYDYEIWQMNVKTAFLNGYLDEDIYMVQPEGFVDPNNPKKVCKFQRSIYGLKQASRSWNKSFDEKIKSMDPLCMRNTKDMFLVYGGNPKAELRVDCYCDAGFETDRDDTKSQTKYVFDLNGGVVDWKSSKQSTTAMFATKAEYIATLGRCDESCLD